METWLIYHRCEVHFEAQTTRDQEGAAASLKIQGKRPSYTTAIITITPMSSNTLSHHVLRFRTNYPLPTVVPLSDPCFSREEEPFGWLREDTKMRQLPFAEENRLRQRERQLYSGGSTGKMGEPR
ncbi:hypothetical protein PROFUN_07727 [Planoprotostelium fungivorum]|uniref:Uncharacterized protein n=1 Tax=Planoprotostelium fungivorum TaxID=1890364 RepID=A0A2P6N1G1_9EUKA|nr:hypothetical protein PROFUN_07727 [Planoprotostelium fungivorum]